MAREQVEGGANILDVNMDEGLIDGVKPARDVAGVVAGRVLLNERDFHAAILSRP